MGADFGKAEVDQSPVVRFGPFTFDRARMILRRDGEPIAIGGRGAALLAVLVDAGGQVVPRAELIDAVWPDLVVEEHNLSVQISALRKAMGDLPGGEDPIRTVSRVGYRLMLDAPRSQAEPAAKLQPTVAVLPFANLSHDADLAFFADGVTEDLITALSRFKTFAVAARGSSFVYKDKPIQVSDVARALNVRYVVEGSVRRSGERIRVSARLTDAHTQTQLWGETFEGVRGDIFDMQDRITEAIVGLVEPHITQAEIDRSRRKPPENLDAYDHFLRGLAINRQRDPRLYAEAVAHFDRAVELDPTFALGLAFAAWQHELRRTFGGVAPPEVDDVAMSIALSERALAVAGNDALVLAIAGLEFHNLKDDGEGGIALVDRALGLNPNSALVLDFAATVYLQRGYFDRAIDLYQRSLRLSPNSPYVVWPLIGIADAHLNAGRFEEAVTWATRALNTQVHGVMVLVTLTVAYAMLDRMDEARSALERLQRYRPGATISELMESLPPVMRRVERYWVEGLRKAGLPEA
jgi:TolB-like protein/tetratricopeptide (TPR) repeat protein